MSDSDTDTDLLPNNVFTFRNQGTTVSAKGPNINNTNISSLSFRNNVKATSINMPWNMDRQRNAELDCDQRSMYYNRESDQRSMYYNRERETSPMSFHSASGMQPRNRNPHLSYYPGTSGSHRSMYNGRSVSPTMSNKTFDSNTSMSAKDIAFAFQNGIFNKFDFQIIKDAYNRFMKTRTRKRIEKRRNIHTFLKGFRRRSGGDSGDQASNSSISSDDCRSTKTSRSTIFKENLSSCRSTKTDISDFRRTMRESNMVRDCSDNFRQNSLKGMFSGDHTREKENWQNMLQKWHNNSMANSVTQLQKNRFRSGFQLPSQRFNQSIASLPISEKPNRLQRINEGNMLDIRHNMPNQNNRKTQDTDSEDEIFPDATIMEKASVSTSGKRIFEGADIPQPDKKRPRLSPSKNYLEHNTPKHNQTAFSKPKSNDFVFAKPQLPLKKQTITKQQKPVKSTQAKVQSLTKEKPVKPTEETNTSKVDLPVEKVISSSQKAVEKLISKSSQPLELVKASTENNVQKLSQNISNVKETFPTDTTQNSTTDLSMRPSFIKRKLFTQKVDIAEKNSSSDSIQADSPQINVYSKIQKEKNRTRKLVTTQSCLNRDVHDDSNLLDLIHRIVPAEHMNVTTAGKKIETQNIKSKPTNAEKFDVTSHITTCNNTDDVSDTFTDEEIFAEDTSQNQQKVNITKGKNAKKQLGVDEQSIQKPPETMKKATNEFNPADKKQNSNNKANKISNQNNVEKQKDINSNENIKKKPIQTKKITGKVDIHNKMPVSSQNKPAKQQVQKALKPPKCKVVIETIQLHDFKQPACTLNEPNSPTEKLGLIKANIYKGVKSFWDTDSESDLEATHLKRISLKNTDKSTTEIIAPDVPVKRVTAQVTKDNKAPINKIVQNKTKPTTQVKTTVNQKLNSTLLEENNLTKKTKNINQSTEGNHVLTNGEVDKELVKTKTKPIVNRKKTIPASRKENNPPAEGSQEETNQYNASLKSRNCGIQKTIKKTTNKSKSNINNNDSMLSNNESQHIKVHNNTLRIRAQRKPKLNRCCGDQDTSHQLVTNNNTTLYRSLRSREIDLSTSLKSDDGNVTVTKKTTTKNKRPANLNKIPKINGEKTLPSDVSFNLATDVSPSDRTLRNKRTSVHSKEQKLRQSDVSFTLTSENKSLNDTVSTRSSKKNRELESLQINSASFYKSGQRSPLCPKLAAERREMNKSSYRRLNKSRQLL